MSLGDMGVWEWSKATTVQRYTGPSINIPTSVDEEDIRSKWPMLAITNTNEKVNIEIL